MKQKKYTKRALCMSLLSMLLCCSMLVGTTFAWFTDSVTSGKNKIVAGNLDVELYHTVAEGKQEAVGDATDLFLNKDGNPIKWEPGAVAVETFKVANEGSLALQYRLALATEKANTVVNAEGTDTGKTLADVLKVAVVKSGDEYGTRDALIAAVKDEMVTLKDYVSKSTVSTGKLLPEGVEPTGEMEGWASGDETFTVVLYWEPGVNDDDYNLKNGAKASDAEVGEVGELSIELSVNLDATQVPYEKDSFDNTYDDLVILNDFGTSASGEVALNGQNLIILADALRTDTKPCVTVKGGGTITVDKDVTVEGKYCGLSLVSGSTKVVTYVLSGAGTISSTSSFYTDHSVEIRDNVKAVIESGNYPRGILVGYSNSENDVEERALVIRGGVIGGYIRIDSYLVKNSVGEDEIVIVIEGEAGAEAVKGVQFKGEDLKHIEIPEGYHWENPDVGTIDYTQLVKDA